MQQSGKSPWAWFPLVVLLSFSVHWAMAHRLGVELRPGMLLPILTGWLALRHGPRRMIGFMLALGVLGTLGSGLHISDRISIDFGVSSWHYILALGTAFSLGRETLSRTLREILHARWRWLRWLVLIALWFVAFLDWDLQWALDGPIHVAVDPALIALYGLLIFSVNWPASMPNVRVALGAPDSPPGWLAISLFVLLCVAGLIYLKIGIAFVSVWFGFRSGLPLLTAIAFLLTVTGTVDWRIVIAAILGFFAIDSLVSWFAQAQDAASTLERVGPTLGETLWRETRYLADAVGAVLLAAALSPFWRTLEPDVLANRRTRGFLLAILIVWLLGLAGGGHTVGGVGAMLLGGVAYVAGLLWRVRGLLAGPLILQICFLASLFFHGAEGADGLTAYQITNIAIATFPFAFFGFLSNRYPPIPSTAGARSEA